eukprot:COSAG01_NODE_70182_length_259_cov_0.650000_1_plen_46_part_10
MATGAVVHYLCSPFWPRFWAKKAAMAASPGDSSATVRACHCRFAER